VPMTRLGKSNVNHQNQREDAGKPTEAGEARRKTSKREPAEGEANNPAHAAAGTRAKRRKGLSHQKQRDHARRLKGGNGKKKRATKRKPFARLLQSSQRNQSRPWGKPRRSRGEPKKDGE